MLRDIISSTFAGEPELVPVCVGDGELDLAAAIKRHVPEVVVMGGPCDRLDVVCGELLLPPSSLKKVVVVAKDARSASLCRLQLECISMEDISPDCLVSAIRETPFANH
jgi:hypothetical protein